MAVARAAVRERPDWWVPALFMRLKSGRLWYTAGLRAAGDAGSRSGPALITMHQGGSARRSSGRAISDALLGHAAGDRARWAKQYRFPMAPHNRDDLPQVAQYLSVAPQPAVPRGSSWSSYLRRTLLARGTSDELPARRCWSRGTPHRGPARRRPGTRGTPREAVEPYSVAGRRCRCRSTSRPQPSAAARAAPSRRRDASPEVELCRWNDDDATGPSRSSTAEPRLRPDRRERPLVYHLFGRFDEPELARPDRGRLLRLPDRRDPRPASSSRQSVRPRSPTRR